MRMVDIETTVIGGGVVGLSIAMAAARAGQEVVVLERNASIGQEVSSRSSEVIHAGLYYPQNSKKAEFCVSGRHKLYRFAEEHGVAARRIGKLVVATSEAELAVLMELRERAQRNGVDDLKFLNPVDVRALEPELFCFAALLSPSSGIVDSHGLMQALYGCMQAGGGSVVLNTSVSGVRRLPGGQFEVQFSSAGSEAAITTRNLFVAAGLGMVDLGSRLPRAEGYQPPRIHFAKGHYFGLTGRAPFQRLVYPVPVEGGLGTHLTLDLQGRVRFGPDVKWVDEIDYSFDDTDGALSRCFEHDIRKYWPALPKGALQPAYTGIRPKISGQCEPSRDFEIHGTNEHGIPRMIVLYGIESPGLTSCLAIGEYCCKLLAHSSAAIAF